MSLLHKVLSISQQKEQEKTRESSINLHSLNVDSLFIYVPLDETIVIPYYFL